MGDHVVHTPHADSGLSAHVGDYYYAYGTRLREERSEVIAPSWCDRQEMIAPANAKSPRLAWCFK